jgi:hypothetical protein
MGDFNDHGVTATEDINGLTRRSSIVSVLSEPNGEIAETKKGVSAETVDFVPTKRYDFRFSREQILYLKRGKCFTR